MSKLARTTIEMLERQYVLTIQNDGDWYGATTSAFKNGWFAAFFEVTKRYIRRIDQERQVVTPDAGVGWICAQLWTERGGDDDDDDWSAIRLTGDYLDKYRSGGPRRDTNNLNDVELDGVDQYCRSTQPNPPKDRNTQAAQTVPAAPTQSLEKDTSMKTESITIVSTTYMNGVDISTLTPDQLIGAIQTCESEIEALGKIKVQSKAITAKVDRINGTITQLVTLLDGEPA